MAQIPAWLVREFSATITPLAAASDGTLTPGSTASLVGQLDSMEVTGNKETENISPMDSYPKNYVPVEIETTFVVTEILKRNGINILAAAYYGPDDYAEFVCARGGQTYDFIGLMNNYTEPLKKGKNTGQLTIQMVAIASGNPTYT